MGRRQSLVRGNSRREALEIGWNGILLFRKPTKKEKKKKRKKKSFPCLGVMGSVGELRNR